MDEFHLDLFLICAFHLIISTAHAGNSNMGQYLLPDNSPNSINSNFTNITTPLFNGENSGKFDDLFLRSVFTKVYNILTNTSPSSNLLKVFLSFPGQGLDGDNPSILYHRFLTVRKDLQDNYVMSRFSQFFTPMGELKDFQILNKNKLWSAMQNYILTIYDPVNDRLLPSKSWTTNNSPRRQQSNQSFANLNQLCAGTFYNNTNSGSNRDLGNYALHMNNNKSLNGYYTQPTSPTPNDFSINFNIPNSTNINNQNNNNNNNNENDNNNNNNNNSNNSTTEDFETAMADILQFPVNSPNENKIKRASSILRFVSGSNIPLGVEDLQGNVLEEMKTQYSKQIAESDERIYSLEKELEQQRQETLWLRKLLLESMGDIRSTLNDMRRQ
ncbi:hypothetical protein RNJ44_02344 [Nakaseomyces bracarensis]|uniref:Uncharacterized protein n=1 Tax=Nakaseomyces bracarensis TaxID=273131 RepID=A0ABR4NN90_9SACH